MLSDGFYQYPGAPSGLSTFDPSSLKEGDHVVFDAVGKQHPTLCRVVPGASGYLGIQTLAGNFVWSQFTADCPLVSPLVCHPGTAEIIGQLFKDVDQYNAVKAARKAYADRYIEVSSRLSLRVTDGLFDLDDLAIIEAAIDKIENERY